MLSACASGGFSLKQAEVDRTFYTSDIPAQEKARRDAGRISDEATIRNAVTSADIESLGGGAVVWANADTGARGSITGLAEYKDNGVLCRRFSTSRENFDGVALFKGEACMASAGAWRMQSFEAL
jgi:surface antigen